MRNVRPGDLSQIVENDNRFHAVIVQRAGLPRPLKFWDDLNFPRTCSLGRTAALTTRRWRSGRTASTPSCTRRWQAATPRLPAAPSTPTTWSQWSGCAARTAPDRQQTARQNKGNLAERLNFDQSFYGSADCLQSAIMLYCQSDWSRVAVFLVKIAKCMNLHRNFRPV